MVNYYEKYSLAPSESLEQIQQKLNNLLDHTTNQLQANPTDRELSNRLSELRKVLKDFATPQSRQQYDAQIHKPNKTSEDIRKETFAKDFKAAQEYLYHDDDADLAGAAIKKAEQSYRQEADQEEDYHLLKANYYQEIDELEKAAEEIATAIVMNDQKIEFHWVRLDINEALYGKYDARTVKVAERIMRYLNHTYIKNMNANTDSYPVERMAEFERMAEWLYFDNETVVVDEMKRSDHPDFVKKAKKYHNFLKKNNYQIIYDRIERYETYLANLEKAEAERKRREEEAHARYQKEQERIRQEQLRQEQERKEQERQRQEAERRRKEAIYAHNQTVEKNKKLAIEELQEQYNRQYNGLVKRKKVIKWLRIALILLPAVLIDRMVFGYHIGFERPYLAPIYGILFAAVFFLCFYFVRWVHRKFSNLLLTGILSFIILLNITGGFPHIFNELFNNYADTLPFWIGVYFYDRSIDKKFAKIYESFDAEMLQTEETFNQQKQPVY